MGPSRSAVDVIREAAERAPDSPALLDSAGSGRAWTFGQLDRAVDSGARELEERGVAPGSLVATGLPTAPEVVVLCHAVWRLGARFLPLHPDWTEAELTAALAAAGAPALTVTRAEDMADWMRGGGDGVAGAADRAGAVVHLDQVAALVMTSGSTGTPRPVSITHAKLRASAEGVIERLTLRADDTWLTSLSLAHVGGLALVHRAAHVGCRLVTMPRFQADGVAALIDAGTVTHLSLVPVTLARLIEARGDRPAPATLRCILVGGAATPPLLLDQALALGYPVALTYGLTEATSQVATAPPEQVRRKPGTVGRPLAGVEVRVDGEILVRGLTVVAEGDGWLRTGDLGHLDADGDLWVTGRLSDRIVTGGVTVEPGEVEAALSSHPDVIELAVIGEPDETWGERIVAVVVPREPSRPPTLENLLDLARSRLAPAKRPRALRIVERLPRGANGKVDRARLRSA